MLLIEEYLRRLCEGYVFSDKTISIDLKKFEKILKRKIHLLFYDKSMSNEFFNNLINGVRLYGVIRNERV